VQRRNNSSLKARIKIDKKIRNSERFQNSKAARG
jgi:hypothetical protein